MDGRRFLMRIHHREVREDTGDQPVRLEGPNPAASAESLARLPPVWVAVGLRRQRLTLSQLRKRNTHFA